jgi:hypothetical protein
MFCPKCGTELPDGSVACHKCGLRLNRRSYVKLSLIIVSVLTLLVVTGYFINKQIKLSALNKQLEEAVGKDSGYTETIIKVESESSSISYKEFFELCEKSIDGRTNLIIELRGLYPEIESELKNNLIDFLNAENELVRQKQQFYRKHLSFSTNLEFYTDHIKDFPTSSYGWDYWEKRSSKLRNDLVKDASDIMEYSDSYKSTYKTLLTKESEVKKLMISSDLRFNSLFEKYEKSNIKFADDAKDMVKTIQL